MKILYHEDRKFRIKFAGEDSPGGGGILRRVGLAVGHFTSFSSAFPAAKSRMFSRVVSARFFSAFVVRKA